MSRFQGKTVVITGASRGIGATLAKRFAREGGAVVASANESACETVAADIVKAGGKALAVIADVTKKGDVIALYDAAERAFGGVDVSIQNAGIITIARIEAMTEKEWDNVMEVNTKGVFLCCQEAISRMRKHKRGGRLINTASGQARQGFIYTPHYAASKFGVVGITQSLAKEVAKEGITVNAFCPGIIETDMWAYNDEVWGKLLGDYKPGELMAEWVQDIPMGRAGTGEDVAGLVTFLASDDAAYITGQTVNVDGGLIMS
jgi:meso-butanediol dehydrogenase/(S,S)-butanediol dehydrogenase/diacetyl reductase